MSTTSDNFFFSSSTVNRVAHEVVGEAALGAETQLIERQHLMYRKFKPPFFCSELYR
jgi:hypothetical protein